MVSVRMLTWVAVSGVGYCCCSLFKVGVEVLLHVCGSNVAGFLEELGRKWSRCSLHRV